jgi:hypothetical protein
VNGISWPRVLAAGVLWAVVYNLVWGVAWFAFMRREWLDAMAAIKQPLPWTPQFWIVWLALTLPIGVASMAYVWRHGRSTVVPKDALVASLAVWVLMTMGLAGWGWQESLSFRIIAMDSTVNLVGMVAASLAGGLSQRARSNRRSTAQMWLE